MDDVDMLALAVDEAMTLVVDAVWPVVGAGVLVEVERKRPLLDLPARHLERSVSCSSTATQDHDRVGSAGDAARAVQVL